MEVCDISPISIHYTSIWVKECNSTKSNDPHQVVLRLGNSYGTEIIVVIICLG